MTDPATAQPPRLLQTAAEQRRATIMRAIEDAAMELFAARSMAEVNVDEIASAAGISLRTLYRYYPTKEQVFSGLPRRGAERVSAALRAQPEHLSPFEALEGALRIVEQIPASENLDRWMRAMLRSNAIDRVARMSLITMTEPLTDALAERCGLPRDSLWVEMAGAMAGDAMAIGVTQWMRSGSASREVNKYILAALEIVGRGLKAGP